MQYRLTGTNAIVNHRTISICRKVLVCGDFFCNKIKMPHKFTVSFRHVLYIRNMFIGNNQDVNRGLRIGIFKGGYKLVFIHDVRGYFF